MPNLWTLGGLSVRELMRRTWSESWHDAVFGQAGRMAFYHFLAIFPGLLIFLAIAARVPSIAPQLKHTIIGLGEEFLPSQASSLLHQMGGELERHMPVGLQFMSVCAGASWAASNGTWAIIYGLNRAYEVKVSLSRIRRIDWSVLYIQTGIRRELAFR